jgi:Flp pilus assembly protein TadG
MQSTAILSRVRDAARRFIGADRGNVAVIFAVAAVPIISFVGAAIDYSRASNARSSMQSALDSTALMLSKDLTDGIVKPADISSKAQTYFNALYTNTEAYSVSINATYTQSSATLGSNVQVSGSGVIDTQFLRVVGFPHLDFNTNSTAAWGNTRMRVAMVLDNTGSMSQNGKLPAMQQAAKDMIDTLSGYNKQTGDVYISIIPFTKDVNVDTTNVNASWINWTEWEAEPPFLTTAVKNAISVKYNNITYSWADIGPGTPCPFDTSGFGRPTNAKTYGFACTDRPATLQNATDVSLLSGAAKYVIPSSGTYAGMICPGVDTGANLPGKTNVFYNGCYTSVANPPIVKQSGASAVCPAGTPNCSCQGSGSSKQCIQTTYQHYWRSHPTDPVQAATAAPTHSTWTGCVNDRDQPYDTTNDTAASGGGTPSTLFYAEQWKDCLAAKVQGMSNQWTTLKNQITAMTANGNTNQSVGLAWAWQSLNTASPPIQAPAKDPNYVYKNYIVLLSDGLNTQNRWSTSASNIDARQEILCQNIKADTANTVFTIQVNIGNADPKSQVLQDCASGANNFQMITSASQTAQAFQNVLTQISKLRVAR